MASDSFEVYLLIAPIAAAFAGFGSLASGLGQRRGSDHARVDAMRLESMLSASLSATLLALLPVTLAGLFLNDHLAVRVSAAVALIALLLLAPMISRRGLNIRGLPGFSAAGAVANLTCWVVALGGFFCCLINTPAGRDEALYLLGLVGLLGSSVVMFSRLIASMLRPHNQHPRD